MTGAPVQLAWKRSMTRLSSGPLISIDDQLLQVARGDIPARYTHLVGVGISPNGRYAVVLLTTNEGTAIELDQTYARKVGHLWQCIHSGTPADVFHVDDYRARPICNFDPLPPEVDHVIVRDRGEEHHVPVENGYFLYVAWKQDTPGDDTADPPKAELVRAVTSGCST